LETKSPLSLLLSCQSASHLFPTKLSIILFTDKPPCLYPHIFYQWTQAYGGSKIACLYGPCNTNMGTLQVAFQPHDSKLDPHPQRRARSVRFKDAVMSTSRGAGDGICVLSFGMSSFVDQGSRRYPLTSSCRQWRAWNLLAALDTKGIYESALQ
jgi:hypothetical protein